jgi:hypothetical protein
MEFCVYRTGYLNDLLGKNTNLGNDKVSPLIQLG